MNNLNDVYGFMCALEKKIHKYMVKKSFKFSIKIKSTLRKHFVVAKFIFNSIRRRARN